jgi:hypothetical protein
MQILHNGVRYNCRIFCLDRQILLIRPKMSLVSSTLLLTIVDIFSRLMMEIIESLATLVLGRTSMLTYRNILCRLF